MPGVKELYMKRAAQYDLTSNLYYLIGVRMNAYRRQAIRALNLPPGSTVLELACGTGLNFPFLQEAIGEEGRIIGMDLTPAMLAKAAERVRRHGWNNVELIEADLTEVEFPQEVDGVMSSFALSIIPAHEEVIRKAAQALKVGGRFVTLDLKLTSGPLRFLNPLGVWISKPFGGSYEAGRRKPWEAVAKHFGNLQMREFYAGFIYLASGTKEHG